MTSKEYYYHIKKRLTLNHIVLAVAVFITVLGVWNTIQTLQRNFALQLQVNQLDQQIAIAELETQTLVLQQEYYKSDEYLELSARQYLGKVAPGEKVIILPKATVDAETLGHQAQRVEPSNLQLWNQFFFGS